MVREAKVISHILYLLLTHQCVFTIILNKLTITEQKHAKKTAWFPRLENQPLCDLAPLNEAHFERSIHQNLHFLIYCNFYQKYDLNWLWSMQSGVIIDILPEFLLKYSQKNRFQIKELDWCYTTPIWFHMPLLLDRLAWYVPKTSL